jgi:hypothetical protein
MVIVVLGVLLDESLCAGDLGARVADDAIPAGNFTTASAQNLSNVL